MLKNKSKIIIGVVLAIITIAVVIFLVFFKNSTVEALSKYGSRGSEVTQIQTKLKRWYTIMEMLMAFMEHKQ